LTFQPAQLCGFQVRDHDDLFPNEIFGSVVAADSGADLPFFFAEIDSQDYQPIRVRMRFRAFNRRHSELDFAKIVDSNHRPIQGGSYSQKVSEALLQKKRRACLTRTNKFFISNHY
jgi:hypothetical protein